MANEIFADTVGRVDYSGGVVRVELVSIEPSDMDGEETRMEVRQRILMPMDGFLHAFGTLGELVDKLVKAGVVARVDGEGEGDGDGVGSAPPVPAEDGQPHSPNFTN